MNIEEYSKIAPQYYSDYIPLLLEKYLIKSTWNSFLDCGCGDGSLLFTLNNKNYFDNKNVFAIDLSKNRINLVKKINSKVKAFVDSAEDLKTIKNESIDFFVSTQVIEHVDDKKMMNEIYRVMKSDGIAYISTVYKKWYGWYFYRNNGRWVLDPTHVKEYSIDKQLFDNIDKNKFKILENQKTLQKFPILDFFINRLNIKNRELYNNNFIKLIRKIKIPILGYYNWEIVLKKL